MNFQEKIEKAIRKTKDSPEKVFHDTCYILAKDFHWSYEDIINTPIPFIMGIMDSYGEHLKQREKIYKKKK